MTHSELLALDDIHAIATKFTVTQETAPQVREWVRSGRGLRLWHLETLREAGLIEIESAPPRGNFVKKQL